MKHSPLASCTVALVVAALAWVTPAEESKNPLPKKAAELFGSTRVWTIHLRFTPEQWAAMEPKGGGQRPFGGPRGGGAFGPAMFVAPTFIGQGDEDKDGKLSKDEFAALAGKWFGEWDKEKRGRLTIEQLRAGLSATFTPPAGGGGPVMVGGRGINLQGAEGQRNGLASSMGIEFNYVHADLEFEGRTLKDVAVRYKGNGTWMQSRGALKRSLKIDLNKFVKGQKLAGVTTLNLHSNVTDASSMNEPLSHRLYRDAGVPAPRTAYARVYVTVPGTHERAYVGLYSLVENIDERFAEEATGKKGGAIFKPVTPFLFADLGDDWAKYKQTYDPKTELTPVQARRVIDFAKLVTHADDAAFAARVGEFLDLDEFARYMAVTVWLSTLDSILGMGQNFYVYLDPKSDKFQFLPWDLDHSFGQFSMGGSQDQREQLSIHRPWRGDVRFLERVFKVEAFKQLYLKRMNEFAGTIFKPERFVAQVDEVAAAIRPAVREESEEKLTRFETAVATQPDPGEEKGSWFAGFGKSAAKPIKGFVGPRAKSVVDQLAGTSEGQTLTPPKFGGRGGPGGPMTPGNFLAPAFLTALDADKDGELTRAEFTGGFAKWFDAWNADGSGLLTDEQLRAGINQALPVRPGMGGAPPVAPGAALKPGTGQP